MTGPAMMLKTVLQALGVKIDPNEVETAFNNAKEAIPQAVAEIKRANERLARIEEKLGIKE